MKRLSLFLVVCCLSWSLLQAAPVQKEAVNLLVNGSFEEGPETEPFVSLNAESKDIKGWIVTRGQIDFIVTYWKAADGKRSLDLNGSPGQGGVKQSFKTKKGTKYKVTFSLAVNPDSANKEKKVGVEAADEKKEFTIEVKEPTLENMGWQTKTWEFTATGDETTLEIYSLDKDDPNCGPALDNVSVVEVFK